MFDYIRFGAGVKFYRRRSKMTAEAFAEALDISVKHLRKIENGSSKPSVSTLVRICNRLNVGVKDCINYSNDPSNVLYRQYKSKLQPLSQEERIFFTKVNERLSSFNEMREYDGN